MQLNFLDWVSIILVIIGALNWGLIGLFDFDLVATLFGTETVTTKIIYSLVGLAGLYSILTLTKIKNKRIK